MIWGLIGGRTIAGGKHVLCEKPLALTLDQARQIVAAADTAGLILATNPPLRGAGSHQAIRDILAAGRMKRVLLVRLHRAVQLTADLHAWRINDAAAGGGVSADICVHAADTARFLLGESPVNVVTQSVSSGTGAGVGSMPSGAQVMAHDSFTHAFGGSGIEVHGTGRSVFANGVMSQNPAGTVDLVTAAGRQRIVYPGHDLYFYSSRPFTHTTPGKSTPAATGADGVASWAIAMAVRQAAETGTRVQIMGL